MSTPDPSRRQAWDVIIIGGGHNGLVTAAYLARAGRKVLVLERRPVLGGAAVSEQIFPGFTFSVFSYVVSLLRPEIIRDLDLPQARPADPAAREHGHPAAERRLPGRLGRIPISRVARSIATRRSDAEAAVEYGRLMYHMAKAVQADPRHDAAGSDLALAERPEGNAQARSSPALAGHGEISRALQAHDDELRRLPRRVVRVRAAQGDQVGERHHRHVPRSPRSPGSAYVLLHHYMGEIDGAFRAWGFCKGGNGTVSGAIAGAAREYGATLRTEAPVQQVLVKDGRATGVVLQSGEEIAAPVVVSGLDARRTYLDLVDSKELPGEVLEQVRRVKFRGSSGKINLALSELPDFTCLPGVGPHHRGAISISPSIDYLERAFDDARGGSFSRRPYMDIVFPSMIDPNMAPPGKHVASIFVQYCPYHVEGGWNDAKREAFADTVIDTLSEYAPNLKSAILHRQVLTPADIERTLGLSEGNIFQGELALQQLFFQRPLAHWSSYRTPIRGYYQCGASTHPGGGVMGAAGRLAALRILADGGHSPEARRPAPATAARA